MAKAKVLIEGYARESDKGFDSKLNFYWYSRKNSRQSKIIEENPKVAISIFDSTAVGDDVDAVYIEAEAFCISDKFFDRSSGWNVFVDPKYYPACCGLLCCEVATAEIQDLL